MERDENDKTLKSRRSQPPTERIDDVLHSITQATWTQHNATHTHTLISQHIHDDGINEDR